MSDNIVRIKPFVDNDQFRHTTGEHLSTLTLIGAHMHSTTSSSPITAAHQSIMSLQPDESYINPDFHPSWNARYPAVYARPQIQSSVQSTRHKAIVNNIYSIATILHRLYAQIQTKMSYDIENSYQTHDKKIKLPISQTISLLLHSLNLAKKFKKTTEGPCHPQTYIPHENLRLGFRKPKAPRHPRDHRYETFSIRRLTRYPQKLLSTTSPYLQITMKKVLFYVSPRISRRFPQKALRNQIPFPSTLNPLSYDIHSPTQCREVFVKLQSLETETVSSESYYWRA